MPPHKDNETAAEHLHTTMGTRSDYLEWCTILSDALINAEVSPYDITESPVTSIFDRRPKTRANVAHFMLSLVEDGAL